MNLSIIILIEYLNKHLDDCIKSILSQKIANFEIILATRKNNTDLDAFILNLLSKHSKNHNIRVIQDESNNINNLLNKAIIEAKGKYISILNQDVIALENTYYEVMKIQEEFEYDVFVLDYINILKDINLSEVYKKYTKSISKKTKKEQRREKKHIKNLIESELLFDFSKISKQKYNNKNSKVKGFKYNPSKVYESLQRLELNYKNKILTEIDIQRFNIVIKKEILINNIFSFPDIINTKIDIYKVLPLIKSISCVKNTAIAKYLNKNTKLVADVNIQEIINQAKNRYKQILEAYKYNVTLYTNSFELIEYFILKELLEFKTNNKNLDERNIKLYLREIYNFLLENNISFTKNKYFNISFFDKILIRANERKFKRYINKEKKKNKIKVLKRKTLIDINRFKRTRINKRTYRVLTFIKKQYKIFTNRFKYYLKRIFERIKNIYFKILYKVFKREKEDVYYIDKTKTLYFPIIINEDNKQKEAKKSNNENINKKNINKENNNNKIKKQDRKIERV